MKQATELKPYEVTPEEFWDEPMVRFSDGFDRAEAAEWRGWRVVDAWGKAAYALGYYPYVIVFFREQVLPSGVPTAWEVLVNQGGDTVAAYCCPTEEIRTQITDYLAWFHWKHQGCEWVQGIECVDQLPDELRGLAPQEALRSEIAKAVLLPVPIASPYEGPAWDQCWRDVAAYIAEAKQYIRDTTPERWAETHMIMTTAQYEKEQGITFKDQ